MQNLMSQMAELIPFNIMLQQMKLPDSKGNATPHDYVFVKADRKRQRAGEIAKLSQVVLSGLKKKSPVTKHFEKLETTIARNGRPQNHYEHATANLFDPALMHNHKVHLRLITRFDGKIVIY